MRFLLIFLAVPIVAFGMQDASVSTTQNPHGKIKWACNDCHTAEAWDKIRPDMNFDHTATGFGLLGAHRQVLCAACHKELIFSHVGTACIDCHTDHHLGQLGSNCADCHTTRDWQPQRELLLVHAEQGFPLTGVHAVADCEACHTGHDRQEYIGTPTACEACHTRELQEVTDPDHTQAAFRVDCERCHRAAFGTWSKTTYEHPASFPLTGAHRNIPCGSCHADGFTRTSPLCYSCHSTEYASTNDPDHESAGFSTECQLCHNTIAWKPTAFDHSTTGFALEGAHQTLACVSCHSQGYSGTPTTCVGCHLEDYNNTTDPSHVDAQFPTDCQLCHSVNAWEPATFDHNTTGFALEGAHQSLACVSCHSQGYAGTPTACVGCHLEDYNNTTDPSHVDAQFPTDCQLCHSVNAWEPATFDHSTTGFALEGAHQSLTCVSCHSQGYAGTPTTCVGCHLEDYNNTSDPSHVDAQFPTDCQNCHSVDAWEPATFDHNTTAFPLLGAHQTLTCINCHQTTYSGTPTECIACHQEDYDNTTDPDHAAALFPTTCDDCHSFNAWEPANWDHDALYFPIYSGAHQNVWASCSECHTISTDYSFFDCTACHEHNRTDTDEDHSEVPNYEYVSTACYSCHPQGRN